ncbi:D-alanine--D-alanine ligase [Natronospirillum operosum]|uniref:D-alanine--D-alanine ligase n=1 Tax=Natronospirillum operosum TaxID=2759953 RepID=A0A4Z0WEK2_9GAMM|nr:D-alanine--D-alanine ligase [Natronospirillum operosum]TGG92728.1 D-alanine--D-alanine ligase [Natronospirillum operosum]
MTAQHTDRHSRIRALGRIAVLYGGHSAERAVSLQSGGAVLTALQDLGADVVGIDTAEDYLAQLQAAQPQRVFIALHGRGGEDGQIQAVLDAFGYAYTGSGVAASAIAMNKLLTKRVWAGSGLPTADSRVLSADTDWSEALQALGGKAVLKPVLEGSSLGISIVDNAAAMASGYAAASQYDSEVIAERFIDGPEYTVGIVGDQALPVIRMEAESGFYDYAAKYERDDTRYFLPSGLNEEDEAALQALSLTAFRTLGCRGWGRIDTMRDSAGRFWLLEANTIPGLTSHSLVPKAARAVGLEFGDLIVRLLEQVEVQA